MNPILEDGEGEKLLKCGPVRLRELLATGQYPAIKEGKEYVIPRESFIAEMNARAMQQMQVRRRVPELQQEANVIPMPKKKAGRRRLSLEEKMGR